jgi:hypothetical protein
VPILLAQTLRDMELNPAYPTHGTRFAMMPILEQFNIENIQLFCKDLRTNPYREFGAGRPCLP